MGIPAGFSVDLIALHSLVAAHGILESPGHYVMDSRLAVGRRRAFIEYERRFSLSRVYALLEKVFLFPFFYLFVLYFRNRLF